MPSFDGRTPGPYVQFPSLPTGKWTQLQFQIDTGGMSSAGSCSPDAGVEAGADAALDAGVNAEAGVTPGVTLLVNGSPVIPCIFRRSRSQEKNRVAAWRATEDSNL